MTFASHVVTTASLKCHILINIFITIYLFFILTWYKQISDSIVWFHCISMKNIFLREVACFAGLASDDSNMSTWSSHLCFTIRVIYEHETGGCEVMFAMVYIIAKYHPHRLIHAKYRFLLHIFVPNCLIIHLSPKPKLQQEHLYIYIVFIRNQLQHGTCSIPIGKEFCSYRCISMQNITHFSWIKQHATFIVYSSPTDWKCCRNNTSKMFWHFPEYRSFDRQYEIVRGKVIRDFVGHVKILSGHVKFWNYVPDGHVLSSPARVYFWQNGCAVLACAKIEFQSW